jgi:hypothetical protein
MKCAAARKEKVSRRVDFVLTQSNLGTPFKKTHPPSKSIMSAKNSGQELGKARGAVAADRVLSSVTINREILNALEKNIGNMSISYWLNRRTNEADNFRASPIFQPVN